MPPTQPLDGDLLGAELLGAEFLGVAPLEQPVSLIMTTGELITADAGDDVQVALEVFRQGRISHIPVLSEDSKLVGVLSPADILKLPSPPQASKRGRTGIRIADVMTKNIETIRPTVQLRHAAQLFVSGGFHSLLVTASDGELVGIVTSSDIIRALIGEYVPPVSD
jgi:CBS domain-containing protein